jgi:hypothetical protein
MNGYHWGMIFLFLLIGYMIGVYMPGPGVTLRAKIGL